MWRVRVSSCSPSECSLSSSGLSLGCSVLYLASSTQVIRALCLNLSWDLFINLLQTIDQPPHQLSLAYIFQWRNFRKPKSSSVSEIQTFIKYFSVTFDLVNENLLAGIIDYWLFFPEMCDFSFVCVNSVDLIWLWPTLSCVSLVSQTGNNKLELKD